jgi:hypothetical protein
MSLYTEILARLQGATGPDENLDVLIENALGVARFERDPRIGFGDADYNRVPAKPLTASIDAALDLLEEKLPGNDSTLELCGSRGAKFSLYAGFDDLPYDGISTMRCPEGACLAILIAIFTALKNEEAQP